MRTGLYFLSLFILLSAFQVFGEEIVKINDSFLKERIRFKLFSLSLTAEESRNSIEEIISGKHDHRFVQNSNYILHLGFPDGREHWVKFSYENQSRSAIFLESNDISSPGINKVYRRGNDGSIVVVDPVRLHEQLITTPLYFPLAAGKATIYLRIVPDEFSLAVADLSVKSTTDLFHQNRTLVFLSLAYGIVISTFFYNFILALNRKARYQHYYVLFCFSIMVYFESRYLIFANHFNIPSIPKYYLVLVNGLVPLSYYCFLDAYLEASRRSRFWLIVRHGYLFSLFSIFALSLFNLSFANLLLMIMILISTPLGLAIGIWAIRRKILAAHLILISSMFPIFGTLINFSPNVLVPIVGDFVCEFAQVAGLCTEILLFSLLIGYKLKVTREQTINKMNHAYKELQTVVYPHQVEMVRKGYSIRETMPLQESQAIVISFDIVRSTNLLKNKNSRRIFSGIFKDCYDTIMADYSAEKMEGSGFRVKEVGDGFICSVGFPFKLPDGLIIEERSFELATEFITTFQRHCALHGLDVRCSVGMAQGVIEGFFPESGAQSYDLFGKAIVLSNRYEATRNLIFRHLNRDSDILIIQESIYHNLKPGQKELLKKIDLGEAGFKVRDDESAEALYYYPMSPVSRQDSPAAS